jgi:hypothetical protein
MSITPIPNQPLKILGSGEVAHNDQLCNCNGQQYYQKVECDDTSSVQVILQEATGLELLEDNSFDAPVVSGTTTGTNGNNIVDAGGDFIVDGVLDDMLATNDTDTTFSYVDAGIAPGIAAGELGITTLTGGFVNNEDYSVYRWRRKTGGAYGAWTGAQYMYIDNGILTKVGVANDVAVFDEFDLEQDVYYKIAFTLQNVVLDNATAGVRIYIGGTEAIYVSGDDNYVFYYYADAPTDLEVVIQGIDCSFEMTAISIKKMTKVTIAARNEATGNLDFIDEDALSVSYNPIQVDNGYSVENDPLARAVFDWSNLQVAYTCPTGCYTLCLLDLPTNNLITNGEMNGETGWTTIVIVTDPWTFTGGVLNVNGGGDTSDNLDQLVNTLQAELEVGKVYTLSMTISNWVSGALLWFLPANNTAGFVFDGAANPNGDIDITLDLTAEAFNEPTIRFITTGFDAGVGAGVFTIDNMIIYGEAGTVEILNCSEPFLLSDSHPCTIKLTWTNENDAFGMAYGQFSIVHSLRVDAKQFQPIYEKIDKSIDTDSIGTIENIYSRTVKKEKLVLREQPEYVHDALSIGLEHDTFNIDGVRYVSEDEEYSPVWRKSSLLAPVTIEVIEGGQLLEKRRC